MTVTKTIWFSALSVVDHTWQGTVAVPFDARKLKQNGKKMTTHRTHAQTASNPTDVEAKTKAFDARRALWPEEDAREEERLRAVGKTLTDALLNTVKLRGKIRHVSCVRLWRPSTSRSTYQWTSPRSPFYTILWMN